MRTLRSWLVLLGTLALGGLPAPAGAQPVGSEFQINTYTPSYQQNPSVASDASGNFVVVWQGGGQDGSFMGIFGQRYDSTGARRGSEFPVNTYTTNLQFKPSVASDANGDFVVVWEGSSNQDGDESGIFGQRYDSGGERLGVEFRVNSTTLNAQRDPAVASDANGNFVVVWSDGWIGDISGQRFDNAGNTLGAEFHVNASHGTALSPSVASDASGNFVVAWNEYYFFVPYGLFWHRFDNDGVPQGDEFQVNAPAPVQPSVASDAGGNFVVVWQRYNYLGGLEIYGQRYNNEGVPLGPKFHVNTYTPSYQQDPSVASDSSGNFVVVWASGLQDGDSDGVFGQRYDSAGVAQGGEFQINSYTTDHQVGPSVAATGTNQFVVAWSSVGQDGSDGGVFGQRFGFSGAQTITVVTPNAGVKWRIGALERIQWTHNLGADATFRIELDRDDDGDYEEMIADAAPVDSATKGSFAWTVTGPRSGEVRLRVSWTDDLSVSDSSDVTFQIRPVG